MFDVIVVGLGAMGSAAACHLASRGKRVLGLEHYKPAHANGSSHGDSRIIRQAYHESPAYVPLVQRAYELWDRLQKDTGSNLLHLTGGLMIGPPDSSVVSGAIRSAVEHNLEYELLDSAQLRQRFPPLQPRSDDTAVYEVKAGFLRPEAAIRAHLHLAERAGAVLHFDEAVERWTASPSGEQVEVVTGTHKYRAARLVLTAGAWSPNLLAHLGLPFTIRRHVMVWFAPVSGIAPFVPERFPIYVWDVDGCECFYGFPATDGRTGGVKVAMHSGGEICSPVNIRRTISDADVDELRRQLRRFIPSLNGPLLKAKTCMYTLTPDEHFIVSLHPTLPQVAIAAGFSGHGFKFSSVIGEILADLALDGRTEHPIELFSPLRSCLGVQPGYTPPV